MEYFLPQIRGKKITSVFFGGGTPSLMDPSTVSTILNFLSKHADFSSSVEVTLEANPTSVEADKFKRFKEAGVNRLSLGIQSLIDEDLKILGRKHNATEALKAIETAANYFDNYSFDLIYARPNQTLKAWELELEQAIKLSANHLSLYQLTIEKGTPFYKLYHDGKLPLPDQELSADMYTLTNEMLKGKELERYEISNYAKKGFECAHNLTYWRYNDYLGIGPGAHSRLTGQRHHEASSEEFMSFLRKQESNQHFFEASLQIDPCFRRDDIKDGLPQSDLVLLRNDEMASNAIMMLHTPQKWLESVATKGHGIQKSTPLTEQERITEIIMMGLRIKEGINKKHFISLTSKNFEDFCNKDYLKMLIEKGFLIINDNSVVLTDEGLNLHNYIIPRLITQDL